MTNSLLRPAQWAESEFALAQLGDPRRTQRLVKIATNLVQQPSGTLPQAFPRWSFVKRAYWEALVNCWRLRKHIRAERRRIQQFRRRGDLWMLRFLRWRLNRWDELQRLRQFGVPKVTDSPPVKKT